MLRIIDQSGLAGEELGGHDDILANLRNMLESEFRRGKTGETPDGSTGYAGARAP